MLFYRMTYTSEMKETERQDGTPVAKYTNYQLKTPPPQSTILRVFKEPMCVSGSSSVQRNDKTSLFIQKKTKKIHSADYPDLLCSSPVLFHDKKHCPLSLMSHLTITSRADAETGLTGRTESNILKELINERFGRESTIQSMVLTNL